MKITYTKLIDGGKGRIEAVLEYKSLSGQAPYFSVTGTIFSHPTSKADKYWDTSGCIHEDIAKHFPELKNAIKYHLVSSGSPLHYVANTVYWYEVAQGIRKYNERENDFKALTNARNAALWPDLQLGMDTPTLKRALEQRLPSLMDGFYSMLDKYGMRTLDTDPNCAICEFGDKNHEH